MHFFSYFVEFFRNFFLSDPYSEYGSGSRRKIECGSTVLLKSRVENCSVSLLFHVLLPLSLSAFILSCVRCVQVVDDRLTRWHKDFNIEACHEIDTEDFPPRPAVEKFTTAQVWYTALITIIYLFTILWSFFALSCSVTFKTNKSYHLKNMEHSGTVQFNIVGIWNIFQILKYGLV